MTNYRIIFRNNLTKEVFIFTRTDLGGSHFYRFPLPLGLTPGEYEYYICPAGGTLVLEPNDIRKSTLDGTSLTIYDCGVAQVGKIQRKDTLQYNLHKTYEQYR